MPPLYYDITSSKSLWVWMPHCSRCYNGRTSFTIENDNDSEVSTQVARYLTEISNHCSVAVYHTLSPLQFALAILPRVEPFLEWNNR